MPARAILVLGMHRSGTSCLAGMLVAAGAKPPGPLVRNWDNPRGHFEATAAVRLNEAVLAHSGGHWLAPPAGVRWTAEQAAQRGAILAPLDGRPALIKDPRSLLVLDFWLEAAPALVGIIRHPLAVARSLWSWRRIPLAQGLALWLDHSRPLEAAHERLAFPLLDFDAAPEAFIAAAVGASAALGLPAERSQVAAAYHPEQVHHDAGDAAGHGDLLPPAALLAEAEDLHRRLQRRIGGSPTASNRSFPWRELEAATAAFASGAVSEGMPAARAALAAAADPGAVLVPLTAELLRRNRHVEVLDLVSTAGTGLDPGLSGLLAGKAHLAAGDAAAAVASLQAVAVGPDAYIEARLLLAQAQRQAGDVAAARATLAAVAPLTIYPFRTLARLAEWDRADGRPADAIAGLTDAIAQAPAWRRGRLRTRLAEWLIEAGDRNAAQFQLEQACAEDPSWTRAREMLRVLDRR